MLKSYPLCASHNSMTFSPAKRSSPTRIMVVIHEKSIKRRNLAYTAWMTRDQNVLGYLFSSLTRETLMHVSPCTSLA
jgi:hypothetical protein